MLSVLRGLVQEGLYGIETQNSNPVSVNKYDELVEQGEYYIQHYTVASSVDLSIYSVNLSEFPTGTYVSNTYGGAQEVFNYGEIFRIMIPKTSFTSDINGKIEIRTKCKTYPIFYGETTMPRNSKLCHNI